MFLNLFFNMRDARLPVSLREYLTLLEAMKAALVQFDIDGFYYLARTSLVKDERHLDRFDQVFAQTFKGLENVQISDLVEQVPIPEDWLRKLTEKHLSEEEKGGRSREDRG